MSTKWTMAGNWHRLASGLAVSGIATWLVIVHTDLGGVRAILAGGFDSLAAGGAVLAYAMFFLFKAQRWRFLLRPLVDVAFGRLLVLVLVGYAGNVVLPFQAGEVARGYLLARRHQVNLAATLSGIALEKFLDFFALLLLLSWALWDLEMPSFLAQDVAAVLAGMLSLTALGIFCVLLRPEATLRFTDRMVAYFPSSIAELLQQAVYGGLGGLLVLRHRSLLLKIIGTSLISWGAMLVALHLTLVSIHLEVPVQGAAVVLMLCAVGLALPTAPGFVGTLQAAFVLGLIPLGITQEAAVAASLLYQALTTVLPLVVGAACLLAIGRAGN